LQKSGHQAKLQKKQFYPKVYDNPKDKKYGCPQQVINTVAQLKVMVAQQSYIANIFMVQLLQ